MKLAHKLKALFTEISREAEANPAFADRLERVFAPEAETNEKNARSHRRKPAAIDPFAEYARGEGELRASLMDLDLERLRDVLAQYGMDRAKLAMKWKDPSRIIDLIVKSVSERSAKGDVFRNLSRSGPATQSKS